jgi:hypothetical protein
MSTRDAKGPTFLRFIAPIVDTLRELGGAGAAGDVVDSVIARLGISTEEASAPTSNGQSRVRNQINWARFYLAKAGYLSAPKRGMWKLTDLGLQATLDPPSVRNLFKDVQDGFDDDEPAEPPPPVATVKFKGPRMVFSDHPFTVNDLLTYIEIGDLGLPDIQRPFVWKATKVRELLDSMFRGYPVGCLLFWGTAESAGGGGKAIGTQPRHKAPKLLVVDGQQRLTSLFAVFRGKTVRDQEFNEVRLEVSFRPRDGQFEVANAATRRDPEFIANISELWAGPDGRAGHAYISRFLATLSKTRQLAPEDEGTIAHNLERLVNLLDYRFMALEILPTVEEELVAEIFVRINSQGSKLSTADFILTLLSVFWDQGRFDLEEFARKSRRAASPGDLSPFNHLIFPNPDQLLRAAIAVGFHRGRLKTVYQILRGKDLATDQFSEARRDEQFTKLKTAQAHVLDLKHWHSFLNAIVATGFRTRELISSENALIDAYALYLIGKLQCRIEQHTLDRLIGRWFFATALTSRYSGQSETTFESDLSLVGGADSEETFRSVLESALSHMLTSDFWTIRLPDQLDIATNQSPAVLTYVASQNLLGAPVLFSHKRIFETLDPAIRSTKKALEFHHIFPRKWLEDNVSTDTKVVNQAANYALLEWPDNISIGGKQHPSEYVPNLKGRFSEDAWVRMTRLHALPEHWESLEYDEFLKQRRVLMAANILRAYEKLSDTEPDAELSDPAKEERATWEHIKGIEVRLRKLVATRYRSQWEAGAEEKIRKVLGEETWKTIERNRDKHLGQYGQVPTDESGVLQYTYLGQLVQLMVTNEAWALFKALFRDRRELEDLVRKISAVRNDAAHFRAVPTSQLRSCQVACDELNALLAADDSHAP